MSEPTGKSITEDFFEQHYQLVLMSVAGRQYYSDPFPESLRDDYNKIVTTYADSTTLSFTVDNGSLVGFNISNIESVAIVPF